MYDTLVSFSYKIKIHGADTTHEHNPRPGVNYCRNTCLHVGKNLLSQPAPQKKLHRRLFSFFQSHFRSVVDRAIPMQVLSVCETCALKLVSQQTCGSCLELLCSTLRRQRRLMSHLNGLSPERLWVILDSGHEKSSDTSAFGSIFDICHHVVLPPSPPISRGEV